VVAQWDGEVTIARLLQVRDGWELTPCNPRYQPTHIPGDPPNFVIIGVVAWHLHRW
jgi:SOS-response transcriptional repressor LexA